VGLDGRYGTVAFGRQTTLAFLNLIRYSAFYASSTFGPSLLHNYLPPAVGPMMTGSGSAGLGDSGWSNTVGYTAPNLGGVVGSVLVSAGEGTTTGRRVGASLNYAIGQFEAGLAIENIDKMNLNFSKPPASILMNTSRIQNAGASYDFKLVKLFGQYIHTKLSNDITEITLATSQISASVPIGVGQILIAYGDTKKTQTAAADQKRSTVSAGYDYYLSKRTDVYAMAMNDKVTGIQSGTGVGFGIRHRF
jgi:predicted porin